MAIKKRLLILAGSLMAIAAVTTTIMATNSNDEKSLLAQNVEALAYNEWDWGGQSWDDDDHWYNNFGNAWKPVITSCTQTKSVGFGGTYIAETFTGEMVECAGGSGDCWNGTPCYPI
jgi:hypothetical protein